MKVARLYGKEDIRIEENDEPEPGHGQVKLKNAFAGLCGSDLHLYYNPESLGVDLTVPHPLTGAHLPQILGHEFSGTVVELGPGVEGYAVGDRVSVWPIYYCDKCAACAKGMFNACEMIAFHGIMSDGGGLAEYTTVPSSKLHKLPENVSLEMGALVEPMAVAWHAVELAGVEPGGSALIAGAGPIGIGLWFALRAHGIDTIVVSEPSSVRRAAIEAVGARTVLDPSTDDLDAAVRLATNGRGVDVAFDAAGVGPAFMSSIRCLTPGGRAVVVAMHEKAFDFDPSQMVMRETDLRGSLAYLQSDFDAVIEAMSQGHYAIGDWVSTTTLDHITDALASLRGGTAIKVIVSS